MGSPGGYKRLVAGKIVDFSGIGYEVYEGFCTARPIPAVFVTTIGKAMNAPVFAPDFAVEDAVSYRIVASEGRKEGSTLGVGREIDAGCRQECGHYIH